jgi:hypothetical protein
MEQRRSGAQNSLVTDHGQGWHYRNPYQIWHTHASPLPTGEGKRISMD